MTGLEKMLRQILEDAMTEGERITAKGKKQAQALLETSQAETGQICTDILMQGKKEQQKVIQRRKAALEHMRKSAILKKKQEIISDTLEKAYRNLCELPEDLYFPTLSKMIERFAEPGEGELLLSRKDKERMPERFVGQLQEKLEKRQATLVLSEEDAVLDGGFVLRYGGVEENCSFQALFDAEKEKLQDIVQEILFSEE